MLNTLFKFSSYFDISRYFERIVNLLFYKSKLHYCIFKMYFRSIWNAYLIK